MIHIFTSYGCSPIPGFKEQTKDKKPVKFQPDFVYVPFTDGKGINLDGALKAGDEVKIGTKLGVRKDFGLPVYSPVSGTIKAIVKKRHLVLGRPTDFFEIANDKKDEKVFLEPLKENPSKEDVVSKLKEGGIVGLGGAGFPTFIKFGANCPIDTLLVNASECEPYLTTDFVSAVNEDLTDFFKGLMILLKACSIQKAYIVCKEDKPEMIKAFKDGIEKSGSKDIEVKTVKDVYPAGFERTMIKMVLNREYDKLPSEAKAIVNNFQTLNAVGKLFARGEVISEKVITVSGLVQNPENIIAPYGTLIKDLLSFAGGTVGEQGVLIPGGPMCGDYLLTDDVPMLIQSDAVTVLEPKQVKEEPCLGCGNCTLHCPVNLQPVEINRAAKRGDYEHCFDLGVMTCVSCGLCSYVCPSHIDVAANVKQAKLMVTFKVPRAQKKPAPVKK